MPLTTPQKSNREWALEYLKMGYSIIPTNGKVSALPSWKKYQEVLPTEAEINQWWNNNSNANIGLITGKISGIVALDFDGESVPEELEKLNVAISQTSPNHFHLFFKYPNITIRNSVKYNGKDMDIRGDGGYVIVPPSTHFNEQKVPDGQYQWIRELTPTTTLDELPPKFFIINPIKEDNKPFNQETNQLGTRNDTTTRVIGSLLSHYPPHQWDDICWQFIQAYNLTNNDPPLGMRELISCFESIKKEELSNKSESQNIYSSNFLTFNELINKDFGKDEWAVEKLIPKNGITCIAGAPKSGKSYISLLLAISLASGNSFLNNFDTVQGKVFLISKEDNPRTTKNRLLALTGEKDLPIIYTDSSDIFLDNELCFQRLKQQVEDEGVNYIIFDSFRRFFTGEENSSQTISQIHNKFKKLQEIGCTIIFIHHMGKEGAIPRSAQDRVRGSSDITAMSDSLITVQRTVAGKIKISNPLMRSAQSSPDFMVEVNFEENKTTYSFGGYVEAKTIVSKIDKAKQSIINALQKEPNKKQVEIIELVAKENTWLKEGTIKSAIKVLVEEKSIGFDENTKTYWFIVPKK